MTAAVPPLCRSPELMSRADTALLVVDMQEKFAPLIPGFDRIVWNIRRLIDAAGLLGIPVAATEQYPKGLGATVAELRSRLPQIPAKLTFSCVSCAEVFADWRTKGRFRLLVCGIETHVCVQQTVLDLMAGGFRAYLAVDAVNARNAIDHEIALRRMESAGATLTTVEASLFEWSETAGAPEFKQISQLVRETFTSTR